MTKITLESLASSIDDLAVMMKRGFDEIHDKFATKEDLKGFATKEDLKRFATKEDFKRFATKEDLDSLEKRVDEKIDEKFEKVMTKEDEVIRLLKINNEELVASSAARARQEDKLYNHEIRISELEKTV